MMRRTRTDGWKALPLVAVAAGALLWHVLACVESPMSFAPNGDLAFVTLEPYDGDDLVLRGKHVYRLMLLPAGTNAPKVLEESSDWMISGAAFSPDGKRIAYFRIPLLTAEDQARIDPLLKARQESLRAATQPASVAWPPVDAPIARAWIKPAEAEPSYADMTLPPAGQLASFAMASASPGVPAQWVERRALDGQVISVTPVDLPLALGADTEVMSRVLLFAYVLGRPQYSPDGQWVCFCPGGPEAGGVALAASPSAKETRLLGVATQAGCLSPDGKTLAVLYPGSLGFVRTDGSVSTYVRWQMDTSPAGMVWTGKDALGVLVREKAEGKDLLSLVVLKTDGTISKTVKLPDIKTPDEKDPGQLALSPDGKNLVVSFDGATYFLDASGKLLVAWEGGAEQGRLAQPTFSRDGKQVAFKLMREAEGGVSHAEAIVFFSPTGKELRRVSIPSAGIPQTQPAKP
ncbi:MAG: hypothetical protein MUP47_01785 [Phycisphaerae bacterium]|nr:hypothetical protein [Phycisphaerae bacterium]